MTKHPRRPVSEPLQGQVREHWWVSDVCRRCGMSQSETWILDHRDRPVIVLAWAREDGTVVRVRPFAYFTGLVPPDEPLLRREQRFPGVPVGSVPTCPGAPRSTTVGA